MGCVPLDMENFAWLNGGGEGRPVFVNSHPFFLLVVPHAGPDLLWAFVEC